MITGGQSHGGNALPELARRLKWIVLVMVMAFALLLGRLWQLQVVRGDRYYQRTVSNVVHERFLPSIRGKIVDHRGVPLADNRPAFNIYVTPRELGESARADLIRLLGLNEEETAKLDARIETGQKRKVRDPVLLLEDISRERAALIDQERYRWPEVEVRSEPYRHYPQGDLAAHLVGYMTQMNEAELDRMEPLGYDASELIGRYGLEYEFENYLRGKKGIERFAVDARGQRIENEDAAKLIEGERLIEPVAGYNVVVTIDAQLQRIAEKAVAIHPAAAVAVVEVDTGRILALVSKPSFDPNVMTGHLTRAEEALLNADPRKPFIDKTLAARYPPGSVYKFVTAIAALEDGLGMEEEKIECKGGIEVSGTEFDCTASHGLLDLVGAIQRSCNVYFWQLAQRIGMDRMERVASAYGFGKPTGLGLNGDAGGRVPTRDWYEQRGKHRIGDTINASTGQGDVEVTVLQVAMAYAALGNGGTLYVPQVVDRVEAADGRVVVQYEPRSRPVGTAAEILDVLHRGMWRVTNEAGGTAFEHGHSDVIEIAGKTGTAEVRTRRKDKQTVEVAGWHPRRSHAWFAGWAPASAPEVAIVVLIEHGGPGGKVAAPVAKQILEGWATKVRRGGAPAAPAVQP